MKTFTLSFSKSINPATYEQIQKMDSFDNFSRGNVPSTSQITKRLDFEEAEEIIELLETGESIELHTN